MKNYRIVEIKNKFYIQKKFLFFWINKPFLTGVYLPDYHGGIPHLILTRYVYVFNTLESAEVFLKKHVLNRFKQKYRGDTIISVVDEISRDYIYINRTEPLKLYGDSLTYRYSKNINYLTDQIDLKKNL